jgi:lysophospholipase L1-like esterase
MPGQLYYLALGDSYASGDGDITLDGADHYLPGTNIYGDYTKGIARETCHISTRSYPMRIATAMELTSGVDMRSVACSGAVMSDILSADKKDAGYVNTSYLGQSTQQISKSGPRLEGIVNASALQAEARTSYIPGRVQQIELVKKSQPKYATIMVGGNDIDFPGVMMACAKNSLPSADETCDYARGSGLAGQAKKVYDLYPKLVAFYEALQEVAPRTTFYAIGYPQFMDATNESCVEMLNLYSQAEREAIHNLISYANGIIRAAANDAGVKYINIENSLTGMELCSSGTGMTGMLDTFATVIYTEYMKSLTMSDSVLAKYLNILPVGAPHELALRLYVAERSAALLAGIMYSPATAISDISQELSHPNAIGHDAIYKSIRDTLGADLLESNVCGGKVSCPTGAVTGRPSIGTYLPGVTVRDGVVYISGNGHVQIERKDSKGKVTTGALIKGVADQLIRIVLDILEGEVDISAPVIVEIHSQPTVLGTMSKVGEGYELDVALPDSVPAGQHVLHIRGQLVDGQQFDIDSPVFVEGPEGDIDDDGISDSVDTCAFAEPTGIDVDEDGTDDKCDLDVSFGTTEGPYGGGLGDGEVEVSMRSMSGDDRNNSPGLSKQMLFAGTGFQGQVGDGILDSTDVSLQRVTDTVADGVDQSSAIWAISAVLFVFGTSLFISRARRAKRS